MSDVSSKQLGETIIEVRRLVQPRLARYARLDANLCKESYQFIDDIFCGIRFTLGPFQADWRIDSTEVRFTREGNQIGVASLAGTDQTETRRAA